MSLLDRFGMDEQERRRRQVFLGITEADADAVRSLRDIFATHSRDFAERFYKHLLSDEKAAEFLADPTQLAKLKTAQAHYFAELLDGAFGDAYFEKRLRVGQTHQHVGLEPVYYLGAYNQYIQLTFPLFAKALGSDTEKVLPALLSLVKVIFLDIGLALDTYFHESTEQLRQRNEELQKALGLYLQAQRREEQLRKLLSHEMRGGLAAVITVVEDAMDEARTSLSPSVRESLESASKRCWSLSNLLVEMLSSQAEGGAAWVETASIFENLAARFGLYAEGRAIELKLPAQAPRAWADPLQLREVFANLVSNAVRCMEKPKGEVAIDFRSIQGAELVDQRHPPGEYILFSVRDNGPGIPAEIRPRLFEPFVRGPNATGRSEGTGLGLYFVRTIIEQGGGRVWFATVPGQGTTFWFTVPTAPPADDRGGSHERAQA